MENPAAVDIADLTKSFDGDPVLCGVSLRLEPGTICALLGPSGSGKTTLLRAIAGLEVPDAGTITIAGTTVSGGGTWVAPERRRVGMVFQDGALFPQMTVAENVAFGLNRAERRTRRVADVLALVGLADFADRLPGTMSGGQQQRVALARALAPQPAVLLLDEPFSNLDTTLRVRVRTEVHELLVQTGVTALFVTHDQEEAFVLGDLVAVVHDGRFAQVAAPPEVYRTPSTTWVAGFVGEANLLPGIAAEGAALVAVGMVPVRSDAPSGAVTVLVRPEHIGVRRAGAVDANGTIELVEYYGHDVVLLVRIDDGPVVRARLAQADVARGDRVVVAYEGPPTVAYAATR